MTQPDVTGLPRTLLLAAGWSWRLAAIALAVFLLGLVFARFQVVVLAVIVAAMLASLLSPAVQHLTRRGWPRLAATWAALFGAGLIVGGVLTLVSVLFARRFGEVEASLDDGIRRLEAWLTDGPLGIPPGNVARLRSELERWLTDLGSGGLFGPASTALEIAAGSLLAVVLLFFLMLDQPGLERWFMARVPPAARDDVGRAASRGWSALAAVVRGTAFVGAFDAAAIAAVMFLLDVPLIGPVVVLTFLGAFIPFAGAFVAGGAASLIALATQGPTAAAIVAVSALVIQQIEGNVLCPVVIGRTTEVNPGVVIIAVTAGATAGGIAGAFVALPAVAVARAVEAAWRERADHDQPAVSGAPVPGRHPPGLSLRGSPP